MMRSGDGEIRVRMKNMDCRAIMTVPIYMVRRPSETSYQEEN